MADSPLGSLLERPNLPLPAGDILSGIAPALMVGTPTAHPADVVEVFLRRDGLSSRVVRAIREPGFREDPTQWFRALLPPLQTGAREDYRVEWTRAGRRIAMLPADGSWLSLLGVDGRPETSPAPATRVHPALGAGQPRFGYDLEFFAALTVNLRAEVIGATPDGYRANFFIKDGCVVGPRIEAEVLPEGGDWMHIRPDGVGMANIKITWRTRDGALILDQATGVFDLGPDGYAKVAAGDFTGSPPLLVTAHWSTADSKWQWLNRCHGIGIGRVSLETLQVQVDIYIPRVGDRIGSG